MGENSTSQEVEIIYFPFFGRAGLAKLMLKMANVAFTNTEVPWDGWETWERKNGKKKPRLGKK